VPSNRQGLQFAYVASYQGTADAFAYQADTTSDGASVYDASGYPVELGQTVDYLDSKNRNLRFKYVKYAPTVAPGTLLVGPVYYKDNTRTVITPLVSDGVTGTINDIAGVLLNLTATPLAGPIGLWIQVSGYLGSQSDANAAQSPLLAQGSVTAGHLLIGKTGTQQYNDVANWATAIPFAIVLASTTVGLPIELEIMVPS